MTSRILNFVLIAFFALVASSANASLIFLYDFPGKPNPGDPGSGLAADQTNPQPSNATFSDFTRTNVTAAPMASDNFGSQNWSTGGSLDSTVFESFSITADVGFHLNLSSLSFTAVRSPTGPQTMQVALFINGQATAYDTYNFSPTTSTASYTFNFGPLTDLDNATTATFKFFGWNAGGAGGQLYLDDVATFGTISNLPEPSAVWPIALFLTSVFGTRARGTFRIVRKSLFSATRPR